MAQSINMLQNAFKFYCLGRYKESSEELLKFKLLKEQSDQNQSMLQIYENIVLCEYQMNRDQHVGIVNKLEEIGEDIKKQQKKKKLEDEGILSYNKAVVLYQAGKYRPAYNVLKAAREQLHNDFYLMIKIDLLTLDCAFQLQDYQGASEIYRRISTEENISLICSKQQQLKQDENQELLCGNYEYVSLLFGSEIPAPHQSPTQICREELIFILQLYKMKFFLLPQQQKESGNKKQSTNQPLQLIYQLDQAYRTFNLTLENNQLVFQNDLQPYIKLHSMVAQKVAKAHKQYCQGDNLHKSLRILVQNESNHQQAEFFQTKQNIYQAQIYNNIGCVHFKLEKYSLAAYYFQQAISEIKQLKEQNIYENLIINNLRSKLPSIYLNLADSLFLDKKFSKAITIYNQLQEQCASVTKFWYNKGICSIELFHEQLPDKNLLNDQLDELPPRYTLDKPEDASFRRYFLQSREVHSDMDEDNSDTQFNQMQKGDGSKMELQHFQQSVKCKELLQNAIRSFRNAIYIQKREKQVFQKEEQINIDQDQIVVPPQNLIQSCYVYLCYALLSRGDFNQAISVCKEALEQSLTDMNKFTIVQYLLECYIEQNKLKEASTFLTANQMTQFLQKFTNQPQDKISIQCRNVIGLGNTNYQEYSAKAILSFNTLVQQFHSQNLNQNTAQNQINQVLQNFDININSSTQVVPIPVLNLLIWYYLRTDNTQLALQLIKRRRLLTGPIGKNKIQLLNISK
ncbi:hypothetical protein pb186bvf_008495 [Paramecium bursaria]